MVRSAPVSTNWRTSKRPLLGENSKMALTKRRHRVKRRVLRHEHVEIFFMQVAMLREALQRVAMVSPGPWR